MKATIESVRAQTSGDWLLTIVDDAYPSSEISVYVNGIDDHRIRYIRKETNEGITANYRTCVELANQEIMVMLGCDDKLLPNYVATILNSFAEHPEVSITQPGVEVIDQNGRKVSTLADTIKQKVVRPRSRSNVVSGERLATNLMHGDWLYWPSLAFRTSAIRTVDFRDGFPIIQDLALIMDMIFQGDQLLIEDTVCFQYRRHSASASSSKLTDGSRFVGERAYFAVAAQQARERGWSKAVRSANLRLTSRLHALSILPAAFINRDMKAARTLLRHGLGR